MDVQVKSETNATPLPQRNPKGGNANQNVSGPGANPNQQQNQPQQQQENQENGMVDKKPRFERGPGGPQGGQGGQMGGNRGNRENNRGGRGRFGGRNQGGRNMNRGGGPGGDKNENDMGGGNDNRGGDRNENRGERRDFRDRNDDRRGGGDRGRKGEDYMLQQKLKNMSGSTHELPPIETEETKFSGRNRLYIGNLTNDVTEEEIRELFKPFGEINEAFINAEKNFAFLKVDYHANAERAKRELDGYMRKNRPLRVRFAPNATIVRIKNLTPYVSNELLFKAFEIFGPVERAVIIVDDRGKPTGEGIVEFARKAGAMAAIRYCTDKCFFLTSSLRPCVVEPFEINDDTDGLPDKSMNKKTQEFFKARQVGPRFAEIGSFEHEYGTRWKQLHELFKQKHEALKRELQMEEEKLEAQMEYARYEHETELLREQLRKREEARERQKMEWEMKERQVEEIRTREEEQMRRQEEDMQLRMNRQDEELRRRQQENTLFMQAQQLNSLLDQQEINQGGNNGPNNNNSNDRKGGFGEGNNMNRNFSFSGGNNMGQGNQDQGFIPFNIGQNKPNRFDDQNQGGGMGQMNQQSQQQRGNNRPWDRRGDDFQNKRRRF